MLMIFVNDFRPKWVTHAIGQSLRSELIRTQPVLAYFNYQKTNSDRQRQRALKPVLSARIREKIGFALADCCVENSIFASNQYGGAQFRGQLFCNVANDEVADISENYLSPVILSAPNAEV
jgi:hypothetical protein